LVPKIKNWYPKIDLQAALKSYSQLPGAPFLNENQDSPAKEDKKC